jgi:hypothetical protein
MPKGIRDKQHGIQNPDGRPERRAEETPRLALLERIAMPKPPKPMSHDPDGAEGGGGLEERQRREKQQDSLIDETKRQGPDPLKTPPPPD